MSVFSAAIDAIFADPNMAADATWSPGTGGLTVPVRLIAKRPDQMLEYGQAAILRDTLLFDVRVSDVAAPKSGDMMVIGTEMFLVQGTPRRDRERLVWTVEARPRS